MNMNKAYLVTSKGDDYGAARKELVRVTPKIAKQYYGHKEIPEEHFAILSQYMEVVDPEDEAERTEEQRYYGN